MWDKWKPFLFPESKLMLPQTISHLKMVKILVISDSMSQLSEEIDIHTHTYIYIYICMTN